MSCGKKQVARHSGSIKRKKKTIEEECHIMVRHNLKSLRAGGRDLVPHCRAAAALFPPFVCGSWCFAMLARIWSSTKSGVVLPVFSPVWSLVVSLLASWVCQHQSWQSISLAWPSAHSWHRIHFTSEVKVSGGWVGFRSPTFFNTEVYIVADVVVALKVLVESETVRPWSALSHLTYLFATWFWIFWGLYHGMGGSDFYK